MAALRSSPGRQHWKDKIKQFKKMSTNFRQRPITASKAKANIKENRKLNRSGALLNLVILINSAKAQ
jgi:hypothetical protein